MAPVVGSGSTPACMALVANFMFLISATNEPMGTNVFAIREHSRSAAAVNPWHYKVQSQDQKNLLTKQVVIRIRGMQ